LQTLIDACEEKLSGEQFIDLFLEAHEDKTHDLFLFAPKTLLVLRGLPSALEYENIAEYEWYRLGGNITRWKLKLREFDLSSGKAANGSRAQLEMVIGDDTVSLSANGYDCQDLIGIFKKIVVPNLGK
jgi:hypothetical protein